MCVCVHDSQGCPGVSVDTLYISSVDRERKNIHVIDIFVFMPFAREKEKDGKADIDVGSQGDQEIDLCVCSCTGVQVGLSSLYLNRWLLLAGSSSEQLLGGDVSQSQL